MGPPMFDLSFSEALLRQAWLLPVYGLFVLAEMLVSVKPFDRPAWLFNLSYWPIDALADAGLFTAVGLLHAALLPFAEAHGLVLHIDVLPPALGLLAWLFLYDLLYYALHRLQHSRWLWPMHALHHADPGLNATTTIREHWLDDAMRLVLIYVPLGFVAFGDRAEAWSPLELGLLGLVAYYPIFLHSNLPIGLGPLNWLIATPQTHRIHHSIEAQHRDRNFATFFPVIDLLFGTYCHPRRGEYPETGVAELAGQRMGLASFNLYPFRTWLRGAA